MMLSDVNPFTQVRIYVFLEVVHKMEFRKKIISLGKNFLNLKLYLRFINVGIKKWILNTLITETMSTIPTQVMKNLTESTITVLIKPVELKSLCEYWSYKHQQLCIGFFFSCMDNINVRT